MSTLYLGTDQESLAAVLASLLDDATRRGDFFAPATVVVPNRYLKKWLQLWLARTRGVAVNLDFQYLEEAMWAMLRALDPRPQPLPLQLLDDDQYRLMVLSVLLDDDAGGPDLAPLRNYLQSPPPAAVGEAAEVIARDCCRRTWQLADLLARLIRDYEFHRQDILIQEWLRGRDGYPNAAPALERSQRQLFQMIVREPDGLRALLGRASDRLFKTLPQYANEVMELPPESLNGPRDGRGRRPRTVHLFGLTHMSPLHIRVLRLLGEYYDLRLYHLNPLAARVPASAGGRGAVRRAMQAAAEKFALLHGSPLPLGEPAVREPGEDLLTAWGRAGAESFWLLGRLLEGERSFRAEVVPSSAAPARSVKANGHPVQTTVLSRLQDQLLDRGAGADPLPPPQDCTVQIVACPGIFREVETVYHTILHNLHQDPNLRQTDIAVLVTDMDRYRPVIQSVFDREPRRVVYNLADFSAAGLSAFGHGLLGLLDLALESFTRSRVFATLLNPCFLARLGVDREQALVWLGWAEALGIYHGWDRRDKQDRGYPDSPLYCWRHGLQRLRLGRLMDADDEDAAGPAPRYQDVIPYADLLSSDKEQLDAFCRAVEGLLPALGRLRNSATTGARWARELALLVQTFLAVPPDRPGEEAVRDDLLLSLDRLRLLDHLHGAQGREARLPLALVREFVAAHLEALEGTRGEYLTGGVTVSALAPLRPIPFEIVFVLGLGEGLFPGTDSFSTFDLRSRERLRGDIRPADSNRFLLLETVLAVRRKLYLLYTSRELQKDQPLQPCSPLNQFRRYLEEHVLHKEFEVTEVPLWGSDPRYLQGPAAAACDVLANYSEPERLRAIDEARTSRQLRLDGRQAEEADRLLREARRVFHLPAGGAPSPSNGRRATVPTVSLAELRGFLRCPAEAALKRHLRLRDEEEIEPRDDEPFYTTFPHDHRLVTRSLECFVGRAVCQTADQALRDWPRAFAELYDDWRLRGRLPEGAFADVDRARFEQMLYDRIAGADGLARFVRERADGQFCGPVLLGDSFKPVGAKRRFPALDVSLPEAAVALGLPPSARLVGSLPLAWKTADAFEALSISTSTSNLSGKDLCRPLLEPLLFYLALRLAAGPGPDGVCGAEWLAGLNFRLHVAGPDGIASFTYEAGDIADDEARAYLARLTAAFLDRTAFDLLPFDLIVTDEELRKAYTLADGDKEAARVRDGYGQRLREAIEQDRENEHPAFRAMDLLDVVEVKVPDDAFVKVRERFRLLDRGPRRARERG